MKYLVIPNKINELRDKDKLNLVLTYALIDYNRKDDTYLSRIPQTEIARYLFPNKTDEQIVNAAKNDISTYIKKLLKKGFIKGISLEKNKDGNFSHFVYKLQKYTENYFLINADFLNEDIPPKIKSFLLLLKSICFNGTNYYRCKGSKFSNKELYTTLHFDKDVFKGYFSYCKEHNLVKMIDNGFMIMNKCLMMDFLYIPDKNDVYKVIYANIALTCIKHNCYFPIKKNAKDGKDSRLSKLVAKYSATPDKITEDMNERIKNYPTSISFDYLTKVLLNEKIDNEVVEDINLIM